MLTELYARADTSDYIFFNYPTQKECQIYFKIIEKEEPIDIRSLHIDIISTLFKIFLRNLPDALLCCELYEDWVEAALLPEEDELPEILKLCHKLPKQNFLVLQYILKIFEEIIEVSKSKDEFVVTPYYLGISIGHLMLWPNHPYRKLPSNIEDQNEYEFVMETHYFVCYVTQSLIKYSNYIINIW